MTTLANLIARMNVYTPINNKEETLKVNAIDQALRTIRRNLQFPWCLRRGTIRIFSGVLEYPIASDHDRLAFINDTKDNKPFSEQPRYVYTSIKEFYEDPTNRNGLAEIWDRGTKYLGVRDKRQEGYTSQTLSEANDASDWALSGDASDPVDDTVIFQTGDSSVRFTVTDSSGTATGWESITSFTDANYKRKYFFRWIYLDSVPTSITLRIGPDTSNYKYATVTTQFNGAPFVADAWNRIAIDLNIAQTTGTVVTTFAKLGFVLTGAATGTYYIDAAELKGWTLQDYWYYSTSNVLDADGITYKQFFAEDGATFDIGDSLLGEATWHDIVLYEACTYLLSDDKEQKIKEDVRDLRERAWADIYAVYPDMTPLTITNVFRFGTDYQQEMNDYGLV